MASTKGTTSSKGMASTKGTASSKGMASSKGAVPTNRNGFH